MHDNPYLHVDIDRYFFHYVHLKNRLVFLLKNHGNPSFFV
jgi:hypothetical protein